MSDNNEQMPKNFKEAYALLEKNAERLQSDTDAPDIDELVSIMEASQQAYTLCQKRIEAVKQAIESFSKQSESDESGESS